MYVVESLRGEFRQVIDMYTSNLIVRRALWFFDVPVVDYGATFNGDCCLPFEDP